MTKWYTASDEVRSSGWANYDRIEKTVIKNNGCRCKVCKQLRENKEKENND